MVEVYHAVERHHSAHRIARNRRCLAEWNGAEVAVDVRFERVLNPLESVVAAPRNVSVDATIEFVGAIFADAGPVVLGALDAHHDEFFPIVVEKLPEPQRFAESCVAVIEQIVSVKHIQHGVPLVCIVVIIRQIEMNPPIRPRRLKPKVKFLYHYFIVC